MKSAYLTNILNTALLCSVIFWIVSYHLAYDSLKELVQLQRNLIELDAELISKQGELIQQLMGELKN